MQSSKNYLQLDVVRSPCEECDHHKQGLSKDCKKCRTCKERIAYNDYVDGVMDATQASMFEQGKWLIISTARYKKKEKKRGGASVAIPEKREIEMPLPKVFRLGRPISIDWEDVKREYIKKVVPKKITMSDLAKIFGISAKHLRWRRKFEGWPDKKSPVCSEKGCDNIAWCKGKCRRCYQRNYMKQRLGILKGNFRK